MIYVVAKIIPGMMGMATTAVLTRLLDPTSYGLFGLSLVVMSFGATMVFDWLGVAFLRFHETRRGDPLVVSTVAQIFLMLAAGSAVLTAIAWSAGLFDGRKTALIATGILMMWTFSWFELVGMFEIANFRPSRYLAMNVGRAFFIILGACGAAWLTNSAVWTAVGTAVGTAFGAMLGGFKGWSLGPSHFDRELALALLMFGLPLAASMALSGLVTSGTRALLELLDSSEALGLYTAGFVLVQNTINVISAGIASAGYQLAVRAVESGDPQAAHRQLTENGTLMIAILAPVALGIALTAHGIAALMVGPKFVVGVTELIPWMAATGLFAGLRAHHFEHAFQLGRRPSLQIRVAAAAAAVALVLGLILIPRYGAVGAAIATTVAMATSCVHAVIAGRAAYALPLPVAGAARVLVACMAMAAVVLCIPEHSLAGFLARIVAGGFTYTAVALMLNVLGLRGGFGRQTRRVIAAAGIRPSRQGG